MTNQVVMEKAQASGMEYKDYLNMTSEEIKDTDPEVLTPEEKDIYETRKLNLHRMSRIAKSYTPGKDIVNEVSRIEERQLWMVITENWCGDSAQNLSYLAKIASLNKNIEFKIILRDSNLEIMDMYLTNGTRSIPKLVVFDEAGNELFQWGARPRTAQQLVTDLKAQAFEKKYFIEKLHSWYAKNRGVDIENEILNLIKNQVS
jgi:hypothetical protein